MQRILLTLSLLTSILPGSIHAADKAALVSDAYKEAFGRTATADEVKHWTARKDWTDRASLVQLHRNWLRSNDQAAREAVANSYNFVFGRAPTAGEVAFWLPHAKKGTTCAEMVSSHQKHIAANAPAEVRANKVIMAKLKDAGLKMDEAGNIIKINGEIVAKPGDYVLSHNGGNMVAAGAGNMVAAGAGNVLPSGAGGFRGYTLSSVGGKPLVAGTLLMDKDGKGTFGRK